MSLFFIRSLDCGLQVPKIIQAVKNTDNIDSVRNRFLYEILYHIVAIRTISKDILSPEEHLKLRVLETITEFPKSVPRIFLQET